MHPSYEVTINVTTAQGLAPEKKLCSIIHFSRDEVTLTTSTRFHFLLISNSKISNVYLLRSIEIEREYRPCREFVKNWSNIPLLLLLLEEV